MPEFICDDLFDRAEYRESEKEFRLNVNEPLRSIRVTTSDNEVLLDEEDAWHVKVINVSNYEMKFDEKEILERFTRADESRHSEGSGLGLAIARTYTEVLGGSFYVTVDGDQFTAHVVMKKPE